MPLPTWCRPRFVLTGAVLVIVAALLIWWASRAQPSEETSPGHSRDPAAYLLEADAHGAVVLSSTGLSGHDRNGAVTWTDADVDTWGDRSVSTCAETCPSLVSSGTVTFGVDDPAPLLRGGARVPPGWGRVGDPRNTIVALDESGSLRLSTEGAGRQTWESRDQTGVVRQWPAVAGGVIISTLTAERTGLTVVAGTGGGQTSTYLFHRTASSGWRLVAQAEGHDGATCVSSDGQRWVLGSTALRTPNGPRSLDLPGSTDAGACSFLARGVVLVANSAGDSGARTRVWVLDDLGGERAAVEIAEEGFLISSEKADVFALVSTARRAVEVYDARGRKLHTIEDVDAALFDDTGRLCLLGTDGGVEWQRP